ncbi:MAG: hypothetical protein ACP5G4_03865, partial [bacterium]
MRVWSSYEQQRSHLGQNCWTYCESGDSVISKPSEVIEKLGREAFGEGSYLRLNYGGNKYIPYQYSSNWQATVGPLDSATRVSARTDCGLFPNQDSLYKYLPKRFTAYAAPEMIELANAIDMKPVFVYMGTCDTTFEISDSFYYMQACTIDGTPTDTSALARRKSLYYDAYCFAQYLFGDPATDETGWAKLRQDWDKLDPVETDLIMLGNDLQNMYAMYYCETAKELRDGYYLYDYVGDTTKEHVNLWPKFEISRELFTEVDETLFYFDSHTDTILAKQKYRNQYAYRYRARLDTVAAAFKAVKPDIKVSAYTISSYPQNHKRYSIGATMAVLAANNIDGYHFNKAMSGGHSDGALNDNHFSDSLSHLNYLDTADSFMIDTTTDSVFSNRFLLNETLGDLILENYLDYYLDNTLDTAKKAAESLFGISINIDKPINISEWHRQWGYRFGEDRWTGQTDSTSNRFNSQPTISNGIKFLEVLRKWNELSDEYELGPLFSYALMNHKRGTFWGLDSLQMEYYADSGRYYISRHDADGGNYYPTENWAVPESAYGAYPSLIAHMVYKNIGYANLGFTIDTDTREALDFTIAGVLHKFMPYKSYRPEEISRSYDLCTADPYISQDGRISVVLVNRDTTKEPPESHTIVCSLKTIYGGFEIDSVVVSMPVIDTALWREACDTIYGDSMFLPLGFAHNGFTYTDAAGLYHRFTPVSYDSFYPIDDPASAPHFKTDSTTYFSIELEPLMFAKVDVYPKRDSVEITLHPGWNHLSIPLYTGETSLYELFHERLCVYMPCTVFAFINMSDIPNEPGKSYLIRHLGAEDTTFFISGRPCYKYITDVYEGWKLNFGPLFPSITLNNMIGSVFDTARYTDNYLPTDIAQNTRWVWYWNPDSLRYQITWGILPTYGCLFRANYSGDFIFPDSLNWTIYKGRRVFADLMCSSVRHIPNFPDTADDSPILEVPPDSLHFYFDVDWSEDKITVWDKETNDTLENVMVIFVVGDSFDVQYTGSSNSQYFGIAESELDIGNDDSTWVILFKQGY